MTLVLLLYVLAAVCSGLPCGRQLAVAQHQGRGPRAQQALMLHGGVVLLTVLYGLFMHAGALWTGALVLAGAAGPALGHAWSGLHPSRELSAAQLRTDAILER